MIVRIVAISALLLTFCMQIRAAEPVVAAVEGFFEDVAEYFEDNKKNVTDGLHDILQFVSFNSTSNASTTGGPDHPSSPESNRERTIAFLVIALPGLFFAIYGHRVLKLTVFLGAFVLGTMIFYLFSPKIFSKTEFCCGENGTPLGHLLVSLGVGAAVGLLALYLLRLGLFAIGAILGMIAAVLLLLTPLHDEITSNVPYAIFYIAFMIASGFMAVLLQKPFIVLCTSFGGMLAFLMGVDYFAHTHFGASVVQLFSRIYDYVQSSFDSNSSTSFDFSLDQTGYMMFTIWIGSSVLCMYIQYRLTSPSNKIRYAPLPTSEPPPYEMVPKQ